MIKRDTFKRGGRGVFKCVTCGRLCRQTRETGDSECCVHCYELAGYENQFSDEGELSENVIQVCRSEVSSAIKSGGNITQMQEAFNLPESVFTL